MHDQIYAEEIIKEAETYGRVKTVSIELGDLAPITGEVLEHAIRNQKPGWRVKLYPKDSKIKCEKCGFEGKAKVVERLHEAVIYECPICGEDLPEVLEGKQIILKSVEIED